MPVWVVAEPTTRISTLNGAPQEGVVVVASRAGVSQVRLDTGMVLWRSPSPRVDRQLLGSKPCHGPCGITVQGNEVIQGTCGGHLRSLDLANGTTRWQAPVRPGSAVDVTPAVTDDAIFAAVGWSEGRVFRLERHTGAVRWSARVDGEPMQLALHGAHLVVSGTHQLASFHADTGALVWSRSRTIWGAALAPPLLYHCERDLLLARNLSDGTVALRTRAPCVGSVLATEAIVVSHDLRRLVATGRQDGKPRWTRPVHDIVGMAASGGILYVTTKTALYALDLVGGGLHWRHAPGAFEITSPPVPSSVGVLFSTRARMLYLVTEATASRQ